MRPTSRPRRAQYVDGIATYTIHHSLREDGVPLSLRGVIPRHRKGHIPAITKPAEIVPLLHAINTYKSSITSTENSSSSWRSKVIRFGNTCARRSRVGSLTRFYILILARRSIASKTRR